MGKGVEKVRDFMKKEAVLCIALGLAILSVFWQPVDKEYMEYIDWNTLMLLFCLMAAMAGFQRLGIFQKTGDFLLGAVKNTRSLLLILCFLPFFFSMLITNDVALITFVPFVAFFIFIGNLGRVPAFRDFFARLLTGHETLAGVVSSQVISNVPAALLLSGFTDKWESLVVGTNLGGLGTLIASMASLISYKQMVRQYPSLKGKYFLYFTLGNVGMLLILLGVYAGLKVIK